MSPVRPQKQSLASCSIPRAPYIICATARLAANCSEIKVVSLLPKADCGGYAVLLTMLGTDSLPETFRQNFHDHATSEKMRYNMLGKTGLRISGLGIGGGGFGGFYGSVEESEAIEAVHLGLKLGLNYIDTAPWYGDTKSESLLGKALADVPRDVYYMATKVGRYKPNVEEMFDFRAERVIASVDESLQRLGLDFVDIVQVHDLEYAPSLHMILSETLPALEKVRNSGKARLIGITGYPVQTLLEVVQQSPVKIDTVLSYCRRGILNDDLRQIIPELQQRGVGVINAAPMNMGLFSTQGPPPWHGAMDSVKVACKSAVNYAKGNGVDLAKLALKTCYAADDTATTLVSMEKPELVRSNVQTVLELMTEEEERVKNDIVQKFFAPLEQTHWENVERAKYWSKLKDHQRAGKKL